MIYEIEVHGFRSLLEMRIAFQPGLNVLVGPNGSGKTNLISFLDFLSTLLVEGLPSAFERVGGAAHAFSVESMRNEEPEFHFIVRGQSTGVPKFRPELRGERPVPQADYEYFCAIRYNKALRVVFVAHEKIALSVGGVPLFTADRQTVVGGNDQAASRVDLSNVNPDFFVELHRAQSPKEGVSLGERLAERVSPEWPLLSYLEFDHPVFSAVLRSLTSLSSINIRPDAARQSTSISDLSTLRENGAGLVSVLYRLKRGQYFPMSKRRMFGSMSRDEQKGVFSSIINWAAEVNPDIVDIDISPNNDDATLSAEVVMTIEGQPRRFSFRKISDGTVKWLTLVTALFASTNYGSIEEPENFLDPRMQEIFVRMLRDRLEAAPRVLLVSTHSESFLNLCRPNELIVFRFGKSGTSARRPVNERELVDALKNSRFGLGHYYRVGAVDA